MVDVLRRSPEKTFSEQLGLNLGSGLGQGAAQGVQQHFANKFQKASEEAKFKRELQKLSMQQQFEKELQKEKYGFEEQLQGLKDKKEFNKSQMVRDNLIKSGVPERIADLYSSATEGGKTEILKNLFEMEQRGMLPEGTSLLFENAHSSLDDMPESDLDKNISISSAKQEGLSDQEKPVEQTLPLEKPKAFKFPKLEKQTHLKPSELVRRQNEREKLNTKAYAEVKNKYDNLEEERLLYDRIEQLNETKLLPEGVGRLNVDYATGDLIIPALANKETQLFAKTVNDFTRKAKESFGSRVTNFDLDRFLKRLPTLANTYEGRKLIVSQMKLLNDMDVLKTKGLVDTYNHYGIENINQQKAGQISDSYIEKDREQIKKRFKTLDGQLDKQYQDELKKIKSKKIAIDEVYMLDPAGNPRAINKKDVKAAQDDGYELI